MTVSSDIARLELDAYTAVLRAMAATPMDWNKEKLLTELRRELHITTDQHYEVLTAVMADPELTAIRSGASKQPAAPAFEAHPAASTHHRPTGSSVPSTALPVSSHRKPLGRPPVRHSPPTASKGKLARVKHKSGPGGGMAGDLGTPGDTWGVAQQPTRSGFGKLGKGLTRKEQPSTSHQLQRSPFLAVDGGSGAAAVPSYALFPHKTAWFASKMTSGQSGELQALRGVLTAREKQIQEELALLDAIEEAQLNPVERTERELQHIQFCERLIRQELAAIETT